jgi:hypothetical protein
VFTERAPVTVRHEALICSTLQSGICIDVLMTLEGRVLGLCCAFSPGKVLITYIWYSFVFQHAEDSGLIPHWWRDRYAIRSQSPKSLLHYCFPSLTHLDSSFFHLCKGTLYFPISCSFPCCILWEDKILNALYLRRDIIP